MISELMDEQYMDEQVQGDNDYHSTEESLVKYFDRFVMIEK